ncbi:MAG TPA: serine hydrolase [Humisphaera sp.]
MSHRIVAALAFVILTAALQSARAAEPTPAFPDTAWPEVAPADLGLDAGRLAKARDYALTGEGSGIVVHRGRLVAAWGDRRQRYDIKSSTKSFGAIALGLAVADGKAKLDDPAVRFQPELGVPPEENRQTGWIDRITLFHLATQTAGFEKPGGYGKLLFAPGTKWRYSDAGPNWLAECLTLVYRRDLNDLMFERVFTPIGIGKADLAWRANAYRPKTIAGDIPRREFGAGISANVEAMSRVGYLMLRDGRWKDRQILPADFVHQCGRPQPAVANLAVDDADEHKGASAHYCLLWWNNGDGALAGVPRDAYWSWGLYDSLIVVVPSKDLVVARAGKSWAREKGADPYAVLAPFLTPICEAVPGGGGPTTAPASPPATRAAAADLPPPSPVIRGVTWDAEETVVRLAVGSDNWPMTWADDGHQYTAFGDGWGFQREAGERKLSVGVARVEGSPPDVKGVDIPSPTIEATGDEGRGLKASGILCADGVLYLWLRNAGNSQLAWSADKGRTWERAAWKLTTSFGCPTFLNAGRNYAGAPDGYAYVYSFDSDDAYTPADRMVLARVPTKRLKEREAYEFFAGTSDGKPTWTEDVKKRAAVFERPGRCFRSGVTYWPAIKRYLWVQRVVAAGDRHPRGSVGNGLAIFDAPNPWGPWTTVYNADRWDIDPGDSAVLPSKWLSPDGRTAHLVFAGRDSFCVRGVTFELRNDGRR